jgi:hypothetical protein
MTLLDRFRAQPRQKHADPSVRLSFVQEIPITERDLLAEIARDDADARVRRAAVAKLMDPAALAAIAAGDGETSVREQAVAMLRDIALEAFEGVGEPDSLAAVDVLADPRALAVVAKSATREAVARRALSRISDPHVVGSIARHAEHETVRRAAFEALHDEREIVPGITMIPAPGETPGHSIVRVRSAGQSFYYLGDLFHYACEVEHPDWMDPGRDPETMRRSRDQLMAEAAATHALVVFTHAPFPGWGRIVPTPTGYRWEWAEANAPQDE